MYRRSCFLFLLLLICSFGSFGQLQPVGQWKEHLPYGTAIRVMQINNKIFTATPYSIFSYDVSANKIFRYSKINGLAEVGISTMGYDNLSDKLIVAYTNSNIDIIKGNTIRNLNDISRKNINGDNTVYDIYFSAARAYISTGFGIVVINADKVETIDTYFPGTAGNYLRTNAVISISGSLYAATADGIKMGSLSADLGDHVNWRNIVPGNISTIKLIGDKIIFARNDSLFELSSFSPTFLYADGWQLSNINISSGRILLSENKPGQDGRVVSLKNNGEVDKIISFAGVLKVPRQAMIANGSYWVADLFGGLEKITGNAIEKIVPNSPFDLSSAELIIVNNKVYAAAGSVNSAWNYMYNPAGLFILEDDKWKFINKYNYPLLDSVNDIITVTADRKTGDVYFGSFGGGLVQSTQGILKLFKQNSSISPAIGDPGSYRISGLAVDSHGNLWMSNFGAANPVVVKKVDGTWESFRTPFTLNQNAVAQIKIDRYDNKWIASPKANGLIFLNSGKLNDVSDDTWKKFSAGSGNGNLPDNQVFSVDIDKDGFVWAGTGNGIAVIACDEDLLTNCNAYLPVIKQGSNTGYLLQNQTVLAIATDGGNRKWAGTTNGVWLISPEGESILEHFTEDNSPLLSNTVRAIAVHPQTGEVFFLTDKGICTFRGTATEASLETGKAFIFPNPVTSGFKGLVAIRGLTENSLVRITELNGRLIHQSRSIGGQAVWNGKGRNGAALSSGAYLVFSNNKVVGKILFIK